MAIIREPAVAGHFYPVDAALLRKKIRSFLSSERSPQEARGIVVPHAGYMYSGAVAGAAYSSVLLPRRFILVGPNHTGRGRPLSIHPAENWRTPLGLAQADEQLIGSLLEECPDLEEDSTAHRSEHSLEVQLPFLQELAETFTFAAICVGTAEYSILEGLGQAMARVIAAMKEPVLIIASSDMNHYESAAVGGRKDQYAIDQVVSLNPEALHRVVRERAISMCGFAPTVAMLTACRNLGAVEGRLIRYANSGDVSGDYESVVGYAGILVQ